MGTLKHEFGHNFGLQHYSANGWDYGGYKDVGLGIMSNKGQSFSADIHVPHVCTGMSRQSTVVSSAHIFASR